MGMSRHALTFNTLFVDCLFFSSEMGAKGLVIPSLDGIHFVNPGIVIEEVKALGLKYVCLLTIFIRHLYDNYTFIPIQMNLH